MGIFELRKWDAVTIWKQGLNLDENNPNAVLGTIIPIAPGDSTSIKSYIDIGRESVTNNTGDIADNVIFNLDITAYKAYALLKVEVSHASWVRLYINSSSRTSDSARLQGQDPLSGSGVLAEVITVGADVILIAPGVIGFNDESPVTNVIPLAVTNLSGGVADITVTLTLLKLEK